MSPNDQDPKAKHNRITVRETATLAIALSHDAEILRARFKNGTTLRTIAKEYGGHHVETVRGILIDLGIYEPRPPRPKRAPEQLTGSLFSSITPEDVQANVEALRTETKANFAELKRSIVADVRTLLAGYFPSTKAVFERVPTIPAGAQAPQDGLQDGQQPPTG